MAADGGRVGTARARAVLVVVFLGLFVDSLLYSIAVPVLPAYSRRFDASALEVGVLFAAYAMGLLVASPAAGRISDRAGRRVPMVAGSLGIAAATVLFALGDTYWLLLVARTVQGAAAAVVWTAGVALIADAFPDAKRGPAMGTAMASMSVGLIAGPPLGGLLSARSGEAAPFLVAAVFAGLNVLLQLTVVPSGDARIAPERQRRPVLRHRDGLVAFAAVAAAAGALSFVEPTLSLYLGDRFHAGGGLIGILFGAATVVHAGTSIGVGYLDRRVGFRVLAGAGLTGTGGVLAGLVLPGSTGAVAVVLCAFAVTMTFALVPALPEMGRLVERIGAGYGAAYALFNTAYAVGMLVGPLGGGLGLTYAGTPVVYAVAGGLVATAGLLILAVDAARRVIPAPETPQPSGSATSTDQTGAIHAHS
ncbi:MFS transporter [Dactylosporangium sp. NPDC051484]|uniref:MFS transporter n=1 Tax=Dactylosporangium sp. NPDC051484 TaxID=3154942 RepID=UPI0034509CBE